MKTTTVIRVSTAGKRVRWAVPRGFGREYRRVAQIVGPTWQSDTGGLRDLLGLVGYEAPHAVVQEWPLRKCVEASVHAANLLLRASDNAIRKHPRPAWMPEPWRGVRGIANAADNPMPTVLS